MSPFSYLTMPDKGLSIAQGHIAKSERYRIKTRKQRGGFKLPDPKIACRPQIGYHLLNHIIPVWADSQIAWMLITEVSFIENPCARMLANVLSGVPRGTWRWHPKILESNKNFSRYRHTAQLVGSSQPSCRPASDAVCRYRWKTDDVESITVCWM